MIGSSSAKNYSGEVAGLITAENCYYLAADGLNGDGANAEAAGVTSKTAEELKASGMAALLGGSYIDAGGRLSHAGLAESECGIHRDLYTLTQHGGADRLAGRNDLSAGRRPARSI